MQACYNKKDKEDACNQIVGGGRGNKKRTWGHIPLHVSVRVFKLPTYNFVFANYLLTLTNNIKKFTFTMAI